jgi:hypothetical protein
MGKGRVRSRFLKKKIHGLLKSVNLDQSIRELLQLPLKKVVNLLFSFLHHTDQEIKCSAVKAMGVIVARMADEDMESARVIMRRLMWNLNDESGGIGWGSPEAMGEILANHEELAKEYVHILISYMRKDGNYLELAILQRGLLWGIKRLSEARPDLVQDAVRYLPPYLQSGDAEVRDLAKEVLNILNRRTP